MSQQEWRHTRVSFPPFRIIPGALKGKKNHQEGRIFKFFYLGSQHSDLPRKSNLAWKPLREKGEKFME